jgi:hypothetical protein
MPTVEKETIIAPTSDNSAGTILGVVFGLLVVAVVCYFLFFNGPRTVEHNTTINESAPMLPSSPPAPNVSNTTINVPKPENSPAVNPEPPASTTTESTTTSTSP